MTLDNAVRKVRKPIMDGVAPDPELLTQFAHMVELHHREASKVDDHDATSQKWVAWLIPKAKQQGWIRLCVEQNLLPKAWLKWPHHNNVHPPELKAGEAEDRSVRAGPGGAIKQKRRER